MPEPTWDETSPLENSQGVERTPGSSASNPTWDNTVDLEEKYGGTTGALKSAGLGAARSTTFGLSDEFLTRTGLMKPEELSAYKEQNPTATTVGEIGGILGSVLAPEAGILGAVSAPVKAVARAGEAVTGAALPIAESLSGTSTVGKILSQSGAKFAGSAVEGAAYGLGQTVSEHALGDPELNGQKVLSNIGYGALFGGAIGGALGVGEEVIPRAVNSAKSALSKLYDVSVGLPGEEPGILGKSFAHASSFVSGKPYEQIVEGLQNRVKSLTNIEDQREVIDKFSNGLIDQHKKINSALYEANSNARVQETSSYLKDVPGELALPEYNKILSDIKDKIKVMRDEPDLYPQSYPRILEQINERVSKEITNESSAFDVFKSLDNLKKRFDEEISYGTAPSGGDLRAQNEIAGIRRSIKSSLENENVWGEAASRQSAFNDAQAGLFNLTGKKGLFRKYFMEPALSKGGRQVYEISPNKINTYLKQINSVNGEVKSKVLSAYLEASENALKEVENTYKTLPDQSFDKEAVQGLISKNKDLVSKAVDQTEFNKALGALGAGAHNAPLVEGGAFASVAYGHPMVAAALESSALLRAPGLAIQRLAKVESLVQKTTKAIDVGVSAIFRTGLKAAEPLSGYIGAKLAPESREKTYKKVSAQIGELTNDPEKMIDSLHDSTKDLSVHAPQISQSLMMSATKATEFLKAKLPQGGDQKPLSPAYKPSEAELSKWQKYFSAVENPTNALHDVSHGVLGSETMEALAVVYPKLLSEMQVAVTDKMTDAISKKKQIPYRTKLSLSLFLGSDMVSSLDPKNMLANQNMLATAAQDKNDREHAQMGGVKQGSLDKMKKSNRFLTAAQASAMRQET